MPFFPTSSLYSKNYPRNIDHMPVVIFFVCLDFGKNCYSRTASKCDRHAFGQTSQQNPCRDEHWQPVFRIRCLISIGYINQAASERKKQCIVFLYKIVRNSLAL